MNNEPKNIWEKVVAQPYRFFLWLALGAVALLALCVVVEVSFPSLDLSPGIRSAAVFGFAGLVFAFLVGFFGFFLALIPPLKPLFRWIVRRSVFLAVCLVTLVALGYAVENWRGKRAWENFKREAKAQGEPFELEAIIPPPVPDEQNVATTPLFRELCNEFDPEWRRLHTGPQGLTNEADRLHFSISRKNEPEPKDASAHWQSGQRTDLKAWQEYYRNPERPQADTAGLLPGQPEPEASVQPGTVTNEFPVAPQPQSPAADVLLALSKYDALAEELRAASARPEVRFPVRYEDGLSALLPHLARMRSLNQFLALRAAAELEAGRIREAAADVNLGLRLADLVREEPILISQLVRLAQLQNSLNPLWEGLAEHRWTEEQLVEFDRQLSQFDFLAAYQVGMRGERVLITTAAIDYLRRARDPNVLGLEGQSGSGPDGVERMLGIIVFHLLPSGWFEQNKVSIGRLHLELLLPAIDEKARIVSPSKVERLSSTLSQRLTDRSPYNWFGAMLLPALGNASARFAQGQAAVDMARVACALERRRLAQGQYPESLDALTPQLLPKLPHDVINGRPLNYRRTENGSFVLYSVGWNETDDGGVIVPIENKTRADWKKGDWVWKYPAE